MTNLRSGIAKAFQSYSGLLNYSLVVRDILDLFQSACTYSKLTIETLEQGVKYVHS